MQKTDFNFPSQYIEVLSRHSIPRILFYGDWLVDLGFQIGEIVEIECAPHRLILSTTNFDGHFKKTIKASHSKEALIEAQRLEAHAWLHQHCKDHQKLSDFLDTREESFVLSSTIFDLVHLLLKAQLLKSKSD